MEKSIKKIYLNDILKLEDLENVKIRFNLMVEQNWNPIELFKNKDLTTLLNGQYWNYKKTKTYKDGQITVGFIRINNNDNLWLLFHVGKITKDLNNLGGVGYEYDILHEYEKYFGRLIIKFKNKAQTMIRLANSVIEECEVVELLPESFNDDNFPGYENVNLSFGDLKRVIERKDWKTALENQKGVYLITDTKTGKLYVGAAYGEKMILGRWTTYAKSGYDRNEVENGKYPNKEFQKLVKEKGMHYIEKYFHYSILDIYKSTTEDKIIINRESRWKNVLKSREFGYNGN